MALTTEQVREKIKGKDVVLLNVLPEEDNQKLHIKNSLNLPLGENASGFAQKVEKQFGRDKFFITYCAGFSCPAGPNAAMALKEKGFRAEDYPGGMEDWTDAGYPVEGTMAHSHSTV
jgi:rhodanese-related sulfurtransferase